MKPISEVDVPYAMGTWPDVQLLTARDMVRGGISGESNQQAIALFRRTETLKQRFNALQNIEDSVQAAQKAAQQAAASAQIVDPNTLNAKEDKREGFALISLQDLEKLAGIAAGATANSTDEHLLDRRNHKNKQTIGTVENLQEALDLKASKQELENAIATVGAFTNVPTEFKGSVISVTSPHTRQMIWAGNTYIRAPWNRPGEVKICYGDLFPGTLLADGFTEYQTSQYPDLAAYLGVTEELFILDKPLEFGSFNICVSY